MDSATRRSARRWPLGIGILCAVIGLPWPAPALAQSLTVQVEDDNDDAEEASGGPVSVNQGTLDLGQQQWVGLRFTGIAIPQGSTIVSAYIETRASQTDNVTTHLTLLGEASDDAMAFGSGNNNLSSRPRTTASATWSNVENWQKNQWYDTPDLSPIVQEIVDRPGWTGGNDLVILIRSDSPSGRRRAFAHDDNGNKAARLHIVYAVAPALVSRWTFDDAAGSVASDMQSAGNHGDILGSYQWQERCDGDGYLELQGTGTYVTVPADGSLNFSGDATFTGWFRLNAPFDETTSTSQVVLEKFKSNNDNMHLVLVGDDYNNGAPSTGALVFKINGGSNAFRYTWTQQTSWQANRWYHFAVLMDAATPANTRVYVDGVDDTAGSSGTINYSDMSFSASLNIGGRATENTPGQRYLDGHVNDFRIYNYQLSASEVASMYGLVAHWKFDETSGSTAADSSANGLDATLAGGVTWVDGLIGGCASFDGINGRVVSNDIAAILNGAPAVTVSLWVKSNQTNVDRGIFDTHASPTGNDDRLGLRYDKDGWSAGGRSLIKGAIDTTAGDTSFESASNVQTTAWQHLAIVWFSGSDPVLYINGQLNLLTDYGDMLGGSIDGVSRMVLGLGTKNRYWDGLIDDVRVYRRALCQDEIDGLYHGVPSQGIRILRWVEAR